MAARQLAAYREGMYYIDQEQPHAMTPPKSAHDFDATRECDFCGEPVRSETAVPRPGGDGGEPVVLCTSCEFGVD